MKRRLYTKFNQILIDTLLCAAAWCAAYLLRYGRELSAASTANLLLLPPLAVAAVVPGAVFGIYKYQWRYVSLHDALRIVRACFAYAVSVVAIAILIATIEPWLHVHFAIIATMWVLWSAGMIAARIARRLLYEHERRSKSSRADAQECFLIIGAGRQGARVAREMLLGGNVRLIGFLDDDPEKAGAVIEGLPVIGRLADLAKVVQDRGVDEVLVCISPGSRPVLDFSEIRNAREIPVRSRVVPTLEEILQSEEAVLVPLDGSNPGEREGVLVPKNGHSNGNGHSHLSSPGIDTRAVSNDGRSFRLEELLGRKAVHIETTRIREELKGKVVLITGAAGSIGSELVRQVASFKPRKVVLLDRSENDLFKMGLELPHTCPNLNFEYQVADILDVSTLRGTFGLHRPSVVFHAAAYKHVPMMERNCFQAVSNNIFGTYNMALLARQFGVGKFVMISSDKAVNPTNIMGVTKRVAELIVLSLQRENTKYVSVRFGNVLGSNGSVVPIFEQQIASGGPVTVTHPETKRYFMTISEAVELVLQASVMGHGGEIFVLDMGEPVKIVDLAHQLIWLSGLEPEKDIQIVFTGLRPGEKLFEELRLEGEGIKPTSHPKIRVLEGAFVNFDQVHGWLDELTAHAEAKNVAGLVECLNKIVPEYRPSEEIRALCEIDCHDLGLKYSKARSTLASPGESAPAFSPAASGG